MGRKLLQISLCGQSQQTVVLVLQERWRDGCFEGLCHDVRAQSYSRLMLRALSTRFQSKFTLSTSPQTVFQIAAEGEVLLDGSTDGLSLAGDCSLRPHASTFSWN